MGGPTDPLLDAAEQFATVISFKDGNTGAARALQQAASRLTKDAGGGGRNLVAAYREIGNMCDVISLPKSIADTSKQLFKRVDEEKLLKGKPQDAIIAACIFIACRQARVPRTFKEIVALTNVEKRVRPCFFFPPSPPLTILAQAIAQCFKVLERAFETSIPGAGPSSSSSADSLITRYCNHLGLPVPVQRAAVFVVTRAGEEGILAGRSPITIAAACILFATALWGQPKSAKEIAAVAGVQDSTIRQSYKYIPSFLPPSLPPSSSFFPWW